MIFIRLKRLFLYDLTYFADYYRAVEKIASGDLAAKVLKIGISRTILIYQAIYLLVVYFYQKSWSRRVNLLAVNLIYLEHLEPINCLWMVGFDLITYSFLQTMFYDSQSGPSHELLHWIFIEKTENELNSNEKMFKKYFTSPNFTLAFQNHVFPVVKVVRLVALVSRNVMQQIIIAVSKLIFYFIDNIKKFS